MKNFFRHIARRFGVNFVRHSKMGYEWFPSDFDEGTAEIISAVKPYTMTSLERLYSLIQAVEYVCKADVPGDIVECGVWRGGSMMAVAHALNRMNESSRNLYLFDTYGGMVRPSDVDVSLSGKKALNIFEKKRINNEKSGWCYADVDQVKKNLQSTGYDMNKIKFVEGDVLDTVPRAAPDKISLLRLDTDWYNSTRHELECLFPRLVSGGVLIIDDYGYWQGSKKATDEYFSNNGIVCLLNRVDDTGRVAIKR